MAHVPYTGAPQVTPQIAPTPRAGISPPGAAFGAAQAEADSHLAAVLSHSGDELFARAYAMQQMDEQAAVINAHADVVDKTGELNRQFRTLSGKAAFDAFPEYTKNVDKIIEEGGAGLNSDYAKRLYGQETRSLRAHNIESAGVHAGTEFKNYQIGTEQARMDLNAKFMNQHPENDALAADSIKKMRGTADSMAALHGWSDEQKQDYLNKSTSAVVYNRVKLLAEKDPKRAKEVLDSAVSEGLISGEHAGSVGEFVRSQRNTVTSRVESQRILEGDTPAFGNKKLPAEKIFNALFQIEGGGNWHATNDFVHKGGKLKGQADTALGIGQVLKSNLSPWLKEAGMPDMTAQQYLNDKDAQKRLIMFKINQLQDQYGNANEVAISWRGRGGFTDAKSGETEAAYLKKFNAALGQGASKTEVREIGLAKAKELYPDDSEFHQVFTDKLETEHTKTVGSAAAARRETVDTAFSGLIVTDPNGALPTSIEQMPPEVQDAYYKLDSKNRIAFDNKLKENASHRYTKTPENQQIFVRWLGAMSDEEASPEDREEALKQNFYMLQIPTEQIQTLVNKQKALRTGIDKGPDFALGNRTVKSLLDTTELTKIQRKEFIGTMHQVMQDYLDTHKKQMSADEIETVGTRMLQETTYRDRGWVNYLSGGLLGNPTDEYAAPMYKVPVPDKFIAKIKADFAAKYGQGAVPSQKQIQEIYASSLYTSLYSKQKAAQK